MDGGELVEAHHVVDHDGLGGYLGEAGTGVVEGVLGVLHHGFGVFAAHLRYRIRRQLIAKWGGCSQHTPTRPHLRQ